MKRTLGALAILMAGCGGVSSASNAFLDPDRITLRAGQGRNFDVLAEAQSIDLVATEVPPAGVRFETESGLGSSRVHLGVECDVTTIPGTYSIEIFTYRYSKESGYVRSGSGELRLTVIAPP